MNIDRPGFADPVHDAQSCFRAVLDALSHPGRVCEGVRLAPPSPMALSTAAVLLTLLDAETPCWLDDDFEPARDWIAFHTGAAAATAARAVFGAGLALPDLAAFCAGSDDAPEQGATLVVQLASVRHGAAYALSGPGVQGRAKLHATGLPEDFAARWAVNHATFPRGIDLILCAGTEIVALPRSVRVEAA